MGCPRQNLLDGEGRELAVTVEFFSKNQGDWYFVELFNICYLRIVLHRINKGGQRFVSFSYFRKNSESQKEFYYKTLFPTQSALYLLPGRDSQF